MWQSEQDMTRFLESQAMPFCLGDGVIQLEPHALKSSFPTQESLPMPEDAS